jgi:hypothetical protein
MADGEIASSRAMLIKVHRLASEVPIVIGSRLD